jgi:hypothetical protein
MCKYASSAIGFHVHIKFVNTAIEDDTISGLGNTGIQVDETIHRVDLDNLTKPSSPEKIGTGMTLSSMLSLIPYFDSHLTRVTLMQCNR